MVLITQFNSLINNTMIHEAFFTMFNVMTENFSQGDDDTIL